MKKKKASIFIDNCCCLLCLGVVRASNIFPILSAILLLMGGVCIAASRFYKSKRNIILGAGILFVAAGNAGISACVFLWQQCFGNLSGHVFCSLETPNKHSVCNLRICVLSQV